MKPSLAALGDAALMADFGPEHHAEALALWRRLDAERPAWCREAVLGDGAVGVHLRVDLDEARAEFERFLAEPPLPAPPAKTVEIPLRYDGEDLDEVARLTRLGTDEVVRLHGAAEYTVRMLGFLPGFPYLDGLPEALRLPRLATPRLAVPAGSVAVAEGQCGIYPVRSPGGWRILGRTDLVLFDPRRDPPALLSPGDRVRFVRR